VIGSITTAVRVTVQGVLKNGLHNAKSADFCLFQSPTKERLVEELGKGIHPCRRYHSDKEEHRLRIALDVMPYMKILREWDIRLQIHLPIRHSRLCLNILVFDNNRHNSVRSHGEVEHLASNNRMQNKQS
jgi:hypothetical protein